MWIINQLNIESNVERCQKMKTSICMNTLDFFYEYVSIWAQGRRYLGFLIGCNVMLKLHYPIKSKFNLKMWPCHRLI